MENTENQNQRKFPLPVLLLGIVLIAALGFFIVANRKSLVERPAVVTPTGIKVEATPTVGSLKLVESKTYVRGPVSKIAQVKAGQPLVVEVSADSAGKNVVGFDLLIKYDQNTFDFVKAESPDPSYRVFSHAAKTHLSITSVKQANAKSTSALSNTSILTLTFTPKQKGSHSIDLVKSIDKESTKLITDQTEILSPAVEGISVEVQ